MEFQISTHGGQRIAEDLRKALSQELQSNSDIEVRICRSGIAFRSIEPSIMVASVSALGSALGAVVGGLLRIAQERTSRKIVIQGSKGQKIEIPADMPSCEIDRILERLKDLDGQPLKVSLD